MKMGYPLESVTMSETSAAGNSVAPRSRAVGQGFKTVVDIDLLGTFNMLRSAWPHLRKPGAAMLNLSADQSWLPMPNEVSDPAEPRQRAVDQGEAEANKEGAECQSQVRATQSVRHDRADPAAQEHRHRNDDRCSEIDVAVAIVFDDRG